MDWLYCGKLLLCSYHTIEKLDNLKKRLVNGYGELKEEDQQREKWRRRILEQAENQKKNDMENYSCICIMLLKVEKRLAWAGYAVPWACIYIVKPITAF